MSNYSVFDTIVLVLCLWAAWIVLLALVRSLGKAWRNER